MAGIPSDARTERGPAIWRTPAGFLGMVVVGAVFIAPSSSAQELIEVTKEERLRYWQPVSPTITRFKGVVTPEEYERRRRPKGYVVMKYVITSEGKVEDVRVLESRPPGVWDADAVDALASYRYEPAEGDAERRPVKVIHHRLSFESR